MLWRIVLCGVLVNLSANQVFTSCPPVDPPDVSMVVAIDSTKMTTPQQFTAEKKIVKNVLGSIKIKYALVIYTGKNATIYKDFGEDNSINGITLDHLNHMPSKTYGFPFESLFDLKYKHMPDCLWLLRNNLNYTYPKANLTKSPMQYDQQIPKIALNFGLPNKEAEMQRLTSFKDIMYNSGKIDGYEDKVKSAICKHCKKLLIPVTTSSSVDHSTTCSTESLTTKTTKPDTTTRGSTQPSTTVNFKTQTQVTGVTPTKTTETQAVKPSQTKSKETASRTQAVEPSKKFTVLPPSSKEVQSTTEEMIKEYEEFLSYNIIPATLTNENEIRKYIELSSRLLLKSNSLQEIIKPENESCGFRILDNLEKFCIAVGKQMATSGQTNTTMQVQTSNLVVGISSVNTSLFEGLTFGGLDVNDGFLSVPSVVFEGHQGTGVIISMILEPFKFFTDSNSDNVTLAGKIINVITHPQPPKTFYPPVTVRLRHKDVQISNDAKPSCVFWDFSKRGWSTAGCSVTDSNASVTECQCNHMTHYAVLLSFDEKVTAKHYKAMTIITYVGCSLSIVGVFLTFITFLCLPVLKSERTRIHCNLCIAIGMSQILFLAAGSKDLVEQKIACQFYAALMFYWFMSVFTWMLVEGVHLYQMIIIAFVGRSMMKFYYAVGWGLPAVIVAIASAITYKGYGTSDFCWISLKNGTIWAFAAPAAIIIFVNMAVLFCVLRLRVRLDGSSDIHKTVKIGARVSVVLLPLLGMTWVFGFFSVLPNAGLVFQYLFAITNSLQGFMIFIFHCVGNSEVRKEFHRKAEQWYFVRTLSSNNIVMTANKVTPISINNSDVTTTKK